MDINDFIKNLSNVSSKDDFDDFRARLEPYISSLRIERDAKQEIILELKSIWISESFSSETWNYLTWEIIPQFHPWNTQEAKNKLENLLVKVQWYISYWLEEQTSWENFIGMDRIQEIRAIQNSQFDTTKLVRILEEINICSKNNAFIWVLALCRTFLNHIPPIFRAKTFEQVVSEFPDNSHKTSVTRLQEIMRKIADFELHEKASESHTTPNRTTVKFEPEFDILLQEIIKKLS